MRFGMTMIQKQNSSWKLILTSWYKKVHGISLYGSSGKSTTSSGLLRFSKASFVASTEDVDGQDVDLDDPEFWESLLGS